MFMSRTKKALAIVGICVGGIVALVALAIIVIIAGEPLFYAGYYSAARREFPLPGMRDGLVQQGLTEKDGVFLSCGYMADGESASRIYVTRGAGASDTTYVELLLEDGSPYLGHAGGLSAYGAYVYVCDSERQRMIVYSADDVMAESSAGESVTPVGAFGVHTNASFCYVADDTLYVGEFYRASNYPTAESHHLTTPAGDEQHALVVCYSLTPDGELGLANGTTPTRAYSVPDLAQGMCVTDDGRIVVSTSYALANSHNYVYTPSAQADGEIDVNGTTVPLYCLDSAALDHDIVLPPMCEELVFADGRVYSIGESASDKYIFGRLLRAKFVWSYELPDPS